MLTETNCDDGNTLRERERKRERERERDRERERESVCRKGGNKNIMTQKLKLIEILRI